MSVLMNIQLIYTFQTVNLKHSQQKKQKYIIQKL